MKDNKVTFICVNYNSYKNLTELIKSISRYICNLSYDIVVIDNNSPERDVENLESLFSSLKVIKLNENSGFSKANNVGSRETDSEYLVFVNPDVLFIEDCISPIIEFMEKKMNVGACGPMLLNKDESVQYSSGFKMGLIYEIAEAFFFIGLLRKLYYFKFRSFKKTDNPYKVAWVSAALLVIKKDVFKDIGGFDSNFFLNYEDIDLCRCLQEKGYKNHYFPYLKSIHYSLHSLKKNYELLVYSRYKSRRIYAKKHYNILTRVLVSFIHIMGIILRLAALYLFYSGTERKQRYSGYKRSLKLYLFRNIPGNNNLSVLHG